MISVLGTAAGLMECYRTLGLDVLTHVLQGQTEMGRAGEELRVINSAPSVKPLVVQMKE